MIAIVDFFYSLVNKRLSIVVLIILGVNQIYKSSFLLVCSL